MAPCHCIPAIQKTAAVNLPTKWGPFRALGFESLVNAKPETALALIMGDVSVGVPLVRIHSQCLTGDVLGSVRCDCGEQLNKAMTVISREGAGILIYEMQEGRGIGLMAKLQAYALQDHGLDTVEANEQLGYPVDCRNFALPVEILKCLGIRRVRLLTNNPEKLTAVENGGIAIVSRVPCETEADPHSRFYLATKKAKLGHLLGTL